MNIYFTASTADRKKLGLNFKKILEVIKKKDYHLTSGSQIINDRLLEKDLRLTEKEIFQRQKGFIEGSDCIIAEVTNASLGVGGEIVYALTKNIPVLALVFENNEEKISPMVAGNPSENFFLEHYNFDKLPYVINEFVTHIKNLKKRKGAFVVIDGGDGSGKTTQSKMLIEYLKKKNISAKMMDFPQYYHSFHGKTVAKFLRGEFGNIDQVSPYLASLAYALDRASVKNEMEDFLNSGGFIVANRYATSNMAHQGAKFIKEQEREDFLKWVYDLEYKIHKIPKENLVIYLYVPWQIGMELTEKKGKRDYLKGTERDIHEKDLNHRKLAENMYLMLSKRHKNWEKIDCTKNNHILSREIIHGKIIDVLKKRCLL